VKDDAAAQSNRLTPQMMAPNAERDFEHLLDFLRQARGFDFRGYKRPSLMRRVSKRAQEVNAATFTD
jgi:two-component system CheB/CheR fusion protein